MQYEFAVLVAVGYGDRSYRESDNQQSPVSKRVLPGILERKMSNPIVTLENGNRVSLREYIEKQFELLERSIKDKAELMDVRLHNMNELQKRIDKAESNYVNMPMHNLMVAHFESELSALKSDARMLRESKAMLEGKASQTSVTITLVVAIVSILLSIFGLILHKP